MNKKSVIILSLVVILIISFSVYYFYFREKEEPTPEEPTPEEPTPEEPTPEEPLPKVIFEEDVTKEYKNPLTNITPKEIKYYEIEYRKESFEIDLFQFSDADAAEKFFNEGIFARFENISKELLVDRNPLTINGFPGYIYKGSEGSVVILQKDVLNLAVNTVSTSENNIQSVIKWFIKNYIRS